MTIAAFAPAKVNLCLHVVGRRPDGFHLLDSLVAFCDIGDTVSAAPAERLSLAVDGPEAESLAGLGPDNLVLRAAHRLAEACGIAEGAALRLEKILPVSSGIGGGSSDAAAALRALAALWQVALDDAALLSLAAELGSDVPACLFGAPCWMSGVGERLDAVAGLPQVGIVLANPRRPLPTAAVFRARAGRFSEAARFAVPRHPVELAAALRATRNDLEAPATALVPEIRTVVDRLAKLPGALLARMSGSGATCFALFPDRAGAERAAVSLADAEPRWWHAAGVLTGGASPLEAREAPSSPVRQLGRVWRGHPRSASEAS
ncbi:MAG: 4-(cytidine 5'-diphospho)-2-C-methyl-D-erythritol kinase [Alphaproteobacteria bacterium]|nr:4-(cytidine 5'-diphospho)-2-C-methyl-D-erythritol kinase [Alphaproteobacteria bacterium]